MLELDLLVAEKSWHDIPDLATLVEQAANAAFNRACRELDRSGSFSICIKCSDDFEVQQLNHQYRGKNRPTNVLSFPFENDFPELRHEPEPLGDIILAFETVSREAREQKLKLSHHIAHLVVHGVFHLFGYDHIEEQAAARMEELEREVLSALQIPTPYSGG